MITRLSVAVAVVAMTAMVPARWWLRCIPTPRRSIAAGSILHRQLPFAVVDMAGGRPAQARHAAVDHDSGHHGRTDPALAGRVRQDAHPDTTRDRHPHLPRAGSAFPAPTAPSASARSRHRPPWCRAPQLAAAWPALPPVGGDLRGSWCPRWARAFGGRSPLISLQLATAAFALGPL